MSNSESGDQDERSKKERLINAWLAAGPEGQATTVAELTDASTGYASEIHTDMEEGELDEDEIEAARDEDLIEMYSERLEQSQADDDAGQQQGEGGEQPAQQRSQPPRQQPPQQQPPQGQQPPPQQSQQAPPQGQQPQQEPPQPQQQQPPQGPPQQTQQGLPAGGQQSVPVSQLQELDDLLAIYEEEAQFEAQNLPPQSNSAALGKLFMVQKMRSLLRNIVGSGQ